MDHDQQFLSFIHKNAAMGVSAIPQVLSLPQSRAMVPALQDQLRECRTIAARAQACARARGEELKGPGSAALALAGLWLCVRFLLPWLLPFLLAWGMAALLEGQSLPAEELPFSLPPPLETAPFPVPDTGPVPTAEPPALTGGAPAGRAFDPAGLSY